MAAEIYRNNVYECVNRFDLFLQSAEESRRPIVFFHVVQSIESLGIIVDESSVNDRFRKEYGRLSRFETDSRIHGFSNRREMRQETNHCGANDVSRKWSHCEGKGGTEGRHKWRGYKRRGNAISKITVLSIREHGSKEHSISGVPFPARWRKIKKLRARATLTPFRSPILAEECNYKWHRSTCSIDQLLMLQRRFRYSTFHPRSGRADRVTD